MDESANHRVPGSLPILNVLDNEHACSYLPHRIATMPLIYPARVITPAEFDYMLAHGIRRSGRFAYFTACENCIACEPTRVDVDQFQWTDSWRRTLNRGDRELTMSISEPLFDATRLQLFNRHRGQRGLGDGDSEYGQYDYEGFLIDTCCASTFEIAFWKNESLVAVSIIDCGERSISAVYTYFDPDHSRLSLGTYSILKQIQLAQRSERQYVYLGMYVQSNDHLNYKARFLPQERMVGQEWKLFTKEPTP